MITPKEWIGKNIATADFAFPFPPVIKRLLSARGFTSNEEISAFLSSSLREMKSPLSLRDMDKAVARLRAAFESDEKVLVYGDFDLDGSSGLSILVDGLKDFGFQEVVYFQPSRLKDGYGLHAHLIEGFKAQGVNLILTVDLGITAIEAAEECKRLGVDLIITDHHLPQENLPDALAVVNPSRKDCASDLKYLCGAGVAYYLLIALKMRWAELGTPHEWDPKAPLDLLVIAILTDMVPLKLENRSLVKHGLLQIQKTKRPAIQSLLKSLKLSGRPLSGQDVAIGLAPKLNALSRLEQGILPIHLFLEKNVKRAAEIANEALVMNDARKDLQAEAEEEARALHSLSTNQNFSFVYSENFHKGVIGLVATKLTLDLQVPSFVATVIDGKLIGSARAPEGYGYSLLEIFEGTKDTLESFGGHRAAAGFQLSVEKAEAFQEGLQHFLKSLPKTLISTVYDIEASLSDLNEETLNAMDVIGPFGVGFPVPMFFVKNLSIARRTDLRGGHLRLQVQDESGQQRTALLFSPPSYAKEISENQRVDLLVELQWNYFNGRKSIQLLVRDIRSRL